ncbi:MAG TPA: efflux RND transporter periplasmic adaptor subunit [Vicinamibacteria bacterium]|nr:efflux RND transporter periplasmic adaptor subunit [Vicinamibacteria bacterium]
MQSPEKPGGGRAQRVFLIAPLALVLLGALALVRRQAEFQALSKETQALAVPTVAVIQPRPEPAQEQLVLPGTLQAAVEAPIYARTSGYLVRWYHDIGSRVRKGEVLAELDTPEIDQQLRQARADLNTARANANLAEITANRYRDAVRQDAVSRQEVDNAVGQAEARQAEVQSAAANLQRLVELEGFKHVYAPFDALVTRRNVDVGTLVNAGNTGLSQQLFTLARTDPIRVYVSVPEATAPAIRRGLSAYLVLTEYPGREFRGEVVRSADAIEPATRTLLTEVDVANAGGTLLPGGYAQVHLELQVAAPRFEVPVNALLFRSEGLRAAVVGADHKVQLRPLTIGRDYGTSLEVLAGLSAGESIVLNPPDSLEDGQVVRQKAVPFPQTRPQEAPGAASPRAGGASPAAGR